MKKIAIKLLALMGLTTIKRQNLAEERANVSDEYARLVTAKAEESGDLIIAGDCTSVQNMIFSADRRLIVPAWVKYTNISDCYFEGEKQ